MVSLWPSLLVLLSISSLGLSASKWHFKDGTVAVHGRGSAEGSFKEKLTEYKAIVKPVTLGAADSLKCIVTILEGKSAARPHQAFLRLVEPDSGLEISYPFSVKESGKAKVDLTHKDIPSQFFGAPKLIEAYLLLGSWGTSTGYHERLFSIQIATDPTKPSLTRPKPLRYGKLPEIHHIFKAGPRSPNIILSLIFSIAVLATLPALLGLWLYLGGNVDHLQKAIQDAPVSHSLFYGSILGIEGLFFLYYTSWNLFQTLPVLLVVGTVTFLSGSRALSEVQARRLAGKR